MYPMGLNIKGRLKSIFRRPLSIESSLHVQKSKCRLLFVMIGKKRTLFLYCILCRHNAKQHYSGLNLNQYGVASPCRTICTVCGFVALS